MHKGREQFWSLLLVAINITVTAVVTLAVMEIGEDTLRSPTDHCSDESGIVRWWFQNLDRYQYIIGKTDEYHLNLFNICMYYPIH